MTTESFVKASTQDGVYPRPQLIRNHWASLDGPWDFRFDPHDSGVDERWFLGEQQWDRTIEVPFPPEAEASLINDKTLHSIVWYRKRIDKSTLQSAGLGKNGADRLLLHFGAVDYVCDVWINGEHTSHHEGGNTPFTVTCPDLNQDDSFVTVIVRAADDPRDFSLPRGKQDWEETPHIIWYHRTTGIWQSVWIEAVPYYHVAEMTWNFDATANIVRLWVRFGRRLDCHAILKVRLLWEDLVLEDVSIRVTGLEAEAAIVLSSLDNGQSNDSLLWSPESPSLIDAELTLSVPESDTQDRLSSYLGLRTIAVSDGWLTINGRPQYLRAVLEQGYWAQSHLTAPSVAALREEVELIKKLGFNSVRVHQKVEDPRFLYWTDRLGILVWAEMAAAYQFGSRMIRNLTTEWIDRVKRDVSHPSIIVWVPMNESWGVPDLEHREDQRAYLTALVNLTRALDSTRPVISNDGWEHTDSDIVTLHDYTDSGEVLLQRYGTPERIAGSVHGRAGSGKLTFVSESNVSGKPVMITEFGGIRYSVNSDLAGTGWGYSEAHDTATFGRTIEELILAIRQCAGVSGFCYTQLTDTLQEENGLLQADRSPKIPMAEMRRIIESGKGIWG